MTRPMMKFRSVLVLPALGALLMGLFLVDAASAQGPTTLTFKHWTIVIEHDANKEVGLGKTFEHCASEGVTTIAATGLLKNSEKGVATVERWYRNGKLYHAFHLSWASSGTGSYTTYGLGADEGLKDGTWKVIKSQKGHAIGQAVVKLKGDPSC